MCKLAKELIETKVCSVHSCKLNRYHFYQISKDCLGRLCRLLDYVDYRWWHVSDALCSVALRRLKCRKTQHNFIGDFKWRLHLRRYTSLQASVDIRIIALWLGYENPATMRHYVEVDLCMRKPAMPRLHELAVKI